MFDKHGKWLKSSLPDEEITLHYIHDNYSCKLLHNRKESNTNIEHIPTAIQADIMLTEKECSTYHGEFDSPLSVRI